MSKSNKKKGELIMSNLKNKIKNFIPQKYNRSYVRMLRLPKKSTLFLTYNIDLIKLILELKEIDLNDPKNYCINIFGHSIEVKTDPEIYYLFDKSENLIFKKNLYLIKNYDDFDKLINKGVLMIKDCYDEQYCCVNIQNYPHEYFCMYLINTISECSKTTLIEIKGILEKLSDAQNIESFKNISDELKIKLDILRSKLSLPLSLVSSVNLKTEGGHESYFQYVARINEFAVIVLKEEKLEMSFDERERYSYQITCLAQLISNLFYLERQMSDICLFDKDIQKVKEMFYFCINTLLINNLFSKIEDIDKQGRWSL